jgi:hypothetical protein
MSQQQSRRHTRAFQPKDRNLSVLLFSYGTLQYKDVQVATFGRELTGREDSLPGYVRTITVARGVLYFNITPSSDPEDAVSGTVSEIS